MGILKTLLKGLGYTLAFTLLTVFFTDVEHANHMFAQETHQSLSLFFEELDEASLLCSFSRQ